MTVELVRIRYADLNARQKENYNFQKISAILADFGFVTLRLSDDWQGADFIAQHIDGETFLKVQLKGRLTFERKYQGKGLYVAFPQDGSWYLYPHDLLLEVVLRETEVGSSQSWLSDGRYSFESLSTRMAAILEPYKVAGQDLRVGRDAI